LTHPGVAHQVRSGFWGVFILIQRYYYRTYHEFHEWTNDTNLLRFNTCEIRLNVGILDKITKQTNDKNYMNLDATKSGRISLNVGIVPRRPCHQHNPATQSPSKG
jgi:hypothetical protein